MADHVSNAASGRLSALGLRLIRPALCVLTLCVYLRTLCPTIFTDDCGEITTAVASGGVMHPPGYPLYALIGGVLIHAIHWGEPAWRLGLLSAIAASGAVVLTYNLTRIAGAGRLWSIAASLAFAFSIALWQQATKVETYALNAFFVALIIYRAGISEQTAKSRDLALFAVCCGLALTNHLTSGCAILGALWLVAGRLRRDPKPIRTLLLTALVGAAPLSLYGLIYLAARTHPGGQVWGDPSNWHRFVLQVTGARYHAYLGALTPLQLIRRDFVGVPSLLWRNLGLFLIGIVPGIARGLFAPRTRRLHQAMLIIGLAYLIETSAYGILNIFEYYTPLVLLLCIWAGIGAEALFLGIARRIQLPARTLRLAASCCILLVVCGSLITHWRLCDRSQATFIRDLAINSLKTLPANAVLITSGDNRVFPLWYCQDVLGIRPDVAVIDRSLSAELETPNSRAEMGWYLQKLQHGHPSLVFANAILARAAASAPYLRSEGPLEDIINRAQSLDRPVFIASLEPQDTIKAANGHQILTRLAPGFVLQDYGLAYKIDSLHSLPPLAAQAAQEGLRLQKIRIADVPNVLMQNEPDGNLTNSIYAQMLGRDGALFGQEGDYLRAYNCLSIAIALNPTPNVLDNFGLVCARLNQIPQAVAALHDASRLDPANPIHLQHLIMVQRYEASRLVKSP